MVSAYISSREVEKIFNQESREKKKIGSNIFSRASTRKGGSNQALRTPYYYMSNKERKKLNGEVYSFNMNELMELDEFKRNDEETQKQLIEGWRKTYKNKEIYKSLGIREANYYDMLKKLNVQVSKRGGFSHDMISNEEMESIKENVASYDKLMSIPPIQRSEVLESYLNEFTPTEVAELMGVDVKKVYNMKNHLKKYSEKKEEENNIDTKKDNTIEVSENDNKQKEKRVFKIKRIQKVEEPKEKETIDEPKDFYFTINKKGESDSIVTKLKMLIMLLEESEDEEYEVSLTVQKG